MPLVDALDEPALEFERPSLTDVAYRKLRESILVGELSAGDRVVVNDLVAKWRISNTPIKEALNRLVAEGLVETLPRRGMRVRLFNAKELREFFEIRTLYEIHCGKVAVAIIGSRPEVIEELRDILARTRDCLADAGSYLKLFRLDESFHKRIVGLCGNAMLIETFDRLQANTLTIGIYANRASPLHRQEETYAEHSRILSALERRSEEGMVEAIREHLGNTARDLLSIYHPESGRLPVRV